MHEFGLAPSKVLKSGSMMSRLIKAYMERLGTAGLESSSNGHKHRRYVQFSELLDKAKSGKFDSFGLSKEATIPWF